MDFRLFVADDFRPLLDGKALAVGMFPDSTIVVHDARPADMLTSTPLAVRIAFLACISGVRAGEHHVRVAIHAPNGEATPYIVDAVQPSGDLGTMNIILSVQTFVVSAGGAYSVRASVDGGEEMTASFTIVVRPGVQPTPPPEG